MAAAKYEISYDNGDKWQSVTPTEVRRRLSKTSLEPTKILTEIKDGRVYKCGGWGTIRRRAGRWNSKNELTKTQVKYVARRLLYEANIDLPIAMRLKDQQAVLDEIIKFCKEQLGKLKDNPEADKYLDKIRRYSP